MPSDLLVIVPSRNRPQNIADLWDVWQATTGDIAELLVAVDDDDPTLPEYEQVCRERGISLEVGPRLRMVPTLNKVAVRWAPHYFALGFLGDDHRVRTKDADQILLNALHELGTGIVYGNDLLAGERLPTAVFITSDIVSTLGYMVPPGIVHCWADNFWYDLGHGIERIRYLPDVIIEHMHPLAGKAEQDAGYVEVNASDLFESDRHAFADWYENRRPTDVDKIKTILG